MKSLLKSISYKFFALATLMGLLFVAQSAHAVELCWVKEGQDVSAASSSYEISLRSRLDDLTASNCPMSPETVAAGYEPNVFKSQILFDTPEITFDDVPDQSVRLIEVRRGLTFNSAKNAVIGNYSYEAMNDPAVSSLYASVSPADPLKPGDDWGYVVFDLRTHFAAKSSGATSAENAPMQCDPASKDVYFRNVVIITNGYTKAELFGGMPKTRCFLDAGDVHVCNGTYLNKDPNGADAWCDEDIASTPLEPDEAFGTDRDGDGYTILEDCNDLNAHVNPGTDEICDGIDNNCDGLIDDESSIDRRAWYEDSDGDGDGNIDVLIFACTAPAGYVETPGDCDDTNSSVHPGAFEICDDLDNNCNALVDESLVFIDWYLDADGDGFGVDDGASTVSSCAPVTGYADNSNDCDDAFTDTNPSAVELCEDGRDNNCDGQVDEVACGIDPPTATDGDGDGFDTTQDCDDSNPNIYPGAAEICGNSVDENCDGVIDESLCTDPTLVDNDNDGFTYDQDCDDSNEFINPGAEEICTSSVDENCNGEIDEEPCSTSITPGITTGSGGCGCRLDAKGPMPGQASPWFLVLCAVALVMVCRLKTLKGSSNHKSLDF